MKKKEIEKKYIIFKIEKKRYKNLKTKRKKNKIEKKNGKYENEQKIINFFFFKKMEIGPSVTNGPNRPRLWTIYDGRSRSRFGPDVRVF